MNTGAINRKICQTQILEVLSIIYDEKMTPFYTSDRYCQRGLDFHDYIWIKTVKKDTFHPAYMRIFQFSAFCQKNDFSKKISGLQFSI